VSGKLKHDELKISRHGISILSNSGCSAFDDWYQGNGIFARHANGVDLQLKITQLLRYPFPLGEKTALKWDIFYSFLSK